MISYFQVPITPVLFTDRDIAMSAAILSMNHSYPFTVWTCVFHLFDMNVKKKVLPIMTANGKGTPSWAGFRKGVVMIREASDPKIFEKMWENLLQLWMPLSETTRTIRNYMYNYVWCEKSGPLLISNISLLVVR